MHTERSEDGRRSYSLGGRGYRVRQAHGLTRTGLSRLVMSIVALAGLAFTACDSSRLTRPLSPGQPSALAFSTPEVVETVPTEFFDPCTAEFVQGALETRQVTDFSDQTPHQTLHMRFRFNGRGVRTVGLDMMGNPIRQLTGTSYNGSGEHNEELNINVNSDKFEWTTTDEFRIFATNYISEAIDDFVMHANTHVTMFFFPPPPRTTSHVDNFGVDCR
jgi:hypothetical protein